MSFLVATMAGDGTREARRMAQGLAARVAPLAALQNAKQLELINSKLTMGIMPTCGGTSSAGRYAVSTPRFPLARNDGAVWMH